MAIWTDTDGGQSISLLINDRAVSVRYFRLIIINPAWIKNDVKVRTFKKTTHRTLKKLWRWLFLFFLFLHYPAKWLQIIISTENENSSAGRKSYDYSIKYQLDWWRIELSKITIILLISLYSVLFKSNYSLKHIFKARQQTWRKKKQQLFMIRLFVAYNQHFCEENKNWFDDGIRDGVWKSLWAQFYWIPSDTIPWRCTSISVASKSARGDYNFDYPITKDYLIMKQPAQCLNAKLV